VAWSCRERSANEAAARRRYSIIPTLIGGILHPVRWAVIAALGIPCALAIGFLFARLAGQDDAGRSLLRILRYALALEILLLVALAFTGFLYERRARDRDLRLYRPPGKLVDIGGYRLHLSCAGGSGPTVVLEYGHQASHLTWYLVQPQIASFTRVCFYDRAGYSWSDPSPQPRVPSVMAEELHRLLHSAGEKPPYILVAHSFGSFNAVMFAHKFPEEVTGLVLVDGLHTLSLFPFRLSERLSLRTMQLMIPFGLPRWRGWCGGQAPEAIRGEKQAITCRASLFSAFYRERAAYADSVLEMRTVTSLGAVPLIVIARDPALGSISDEAGNWQQVQQEKLRLSKNAELVIATGSGHDVPHVRPDLIIVAVRKLIAQASGTGGHPGNSLR
jgi:pimeloyl-ACP methyl ester carboxylesterase